MEMLYIKRYWTNQTIVNVYEHISLKFVFLLPSFGLD